MGYGGLVRSRRLGLRKVGVIGRNIRKRLRFTGSDTATSIARGGSNGERKEWLRQGYCLGARMREVLLHRRGGWVRVPRLRVRDDQRSLRELLGEVAAAGGEPLGGGWNGMRVSMLRELIRLGVVEVVGLNPGRYRVTRLGREATAHRRRKPAGRSSMISRSEGGSLHFPPRDIDSGPGFRTDPVVLVSRTGKSRFSVLVSWTGFGPDFQDRFLFFLAAT